MVSNSKVVWYDGMLLRPQHFQQHDRYFESLIRDRSGHLRPYDWGILDLVLDEHALAAGKLAVRTCRGILPDGTPFTIPSEDDPPVPLSIDATVRDTWVLLALPERNAQLEVDNEANPSLSARYRMSNQVLRDNTVSSEKRDETIKVGKPQFRLLLESERAHGGYSVIRIARISEKREHQILLEQDFIPPLLNCRSCPLLGGYLDEIGSLLTQSAEELASRVSVPLEEGVDETERLLKLLVVNRYQGLFDHLRHTQGLHPELFFSVALQLAGEIATFSHNPRRLPVVPRYDHDNLQLSFKPLLDELRTSLRSADIPRITEIPLENIDNVKYLARLSASQKTLLEDAHVILMVKLAEGQSEVFPNQCTVSSAEELMRLVAEIIPGIKLRRLNVVHAQIYDREFTYYELDQNSEYWHGVTVSSVGLAFNVAGHFPGISMRLWSIKEIRR